MDGIINVLSVATIAACGEDATDNTKYIYQSRFIEQMENSINIQTYFHQTQSMKMEMEQITVFMYSDSKGKCAKLDHSMNHPSDASFLKLENEEHSSKIKSILNDETSMTTSNNNNKIKS